MYITTKTVKSEAKGVRFLQTTMTSEL